MRGQLLLDLKDLRAMLTEVSERVTEIKARYGNVSAASVGAIQRGLLALESQGAALFFGEPMLDIADLMQVDEAWHGVVNVLAADVLMQSAQLYGIFYYGCWRIFMNDCPKWAIWLNRNLFSSLMRLIFYSRMRQRR